MKELFVPDTESITSKITSIRNKFAFVDEFKTMINDIKAYLLDKESIIPVIRLDLGNAEGKYKYGDTAYILDMTWYLRYKPTVDKIIIAFAYLGFIFLVFKRLPDIIAGTGAITDKTDDLDRGYRISFRKRGNNDDN